MEMIIVFSLLLAFVECVFGNCVCGKENLQSRIVGGVETPANAYPWLAYVKVRSMGRVFSCGGALISDQYILTAAHCFYGKPELMADIYLGGHRFADFFDKKTRKHEAIKIKLHENYIHDPLSVHDIAVVKLRQKIQFSKDISPICLLEQNLNFTNFVVAGWGRLNSNDNAATKAERPDNLMHVDIPFIPFEKCNKHWFDGLNENAHLCAGENGKDSCQGDSGGPLMMRSAGRIYSAGVISFGKGCGSSTGGVYTKVSSYIPWIKKHTQDSVYCS